MPSGDLPEPRLLVLTKGGSKDLDDDVLSVKSVDADASEFVVKVDVDASKFKPGIYDGLIAMRAPYVGPNRTPISVSRSEDRVWLPMLLGAIAGLAGLVWFALLKAVTNTKLAVPKRMLPWVALACTLACMVAGVLAVFVSYWDQDVWSLNDNLVSALTAGFTGATTGAMVALLGVVWKQPVATNAAPPASGPPAPARRAAG
jgi:hypothetical protein